ncbi:hypothetical protein HSBAA_58100 [Vreelandella sulfidaeris]|uniref:Malonyl-CoA decarboxylase N-terminal domain-containing protein n=1 Tax=Vreelandella sulfidaeris TaxID=115553 RepID=A0A455UNH3_9GAMM|nr:hypothetical protein HSBAA_58100 [Halomonas sulfidaeris]
MREDLLVLLRDQPELKAIDDDFAHLFGSWFNRGFLMLKRIDWNTPASILERSFAMRLFTKFRTGMTYADGWTRVTGVVSPSSIRQLVMSR